MRIHYATRQLIPHGGDLLTPPVVGPAGATAAPVLFRFRDGVDAAPVAMSRAEIEALGDVFTTQVLLRGRMPRTLRELIDAVSAAAPALPVSKMFLVSEGAHPRKRVPTFELNARIVFTWQASLSVPPDVLLSTVASADDPSSLLQLIAWSANDRAFHFFERERNSGAWAWAGNSFDALRAPTRGKGPFDSHINGGLVMKELKKPWAHWHSQSGSISRDVFDPSSEFRTDPLFQDLEGAEVLEAIVKTGVRRWTKGRLARDLRGGVLHELPTYLRQLLWCTSVNLTSSPDGPDTADGDIQLPRSFFYDAEAIEFLAQGVDDTLDVIPTGQLLVDAAAYREALVSRGVRVRDDAQPPVESEGDTQFAFLVPERAFEDQAVVVELVNQGVLSSRLGLCLSMVDFSNPVFSPQRAQLMGYIPSAVPAGSDGAALDLALLGALPANAAPGSAEAEFLDYWHDPNLVASVRDRLAAYHQAVQAALSQQAGIETILDLANSRRRVFTRPNRMLAEFSATLAHGQATTAHMAMRADATVYVKTTDLGEGEL